MTRHMGSGLIQEMIKKGHFSEKSYLRIDELANWSIFRADEYFQLKRNQYASKYFKQCLENKWPKCTKGIRKFWNSSDKNPELGLDLAKLLQHHVLDKDLWEYAKATTSTEYGEFYCQRPFVQKIIVAHLGQFQEKLNDLKQEMDKWIHKDCWQQLEKPLRHSLSSGNPKARNFSYRLLGLRSKLTQGEKDLFLALYILEGPVVGKVFNLAWGTLKIIGQDYKRRDRLFGKLIPLDPLPGKVFGHPNIEKVKVVISFLHNNIPEYVDHYARTCINFYAGKGDFPNGNPTIECRDLLKHTVGKPWVDPGIQIRYSGLRKL